MPIKASAKKELRKTKKRASHNRWRKNQIKDLQKQIKSFLTANKKPEAQKLVSAFYKAVDKAAKSKAIKKKTASRKKSRISRLINKQA